jgi:hypothetical protein
MRASFKRNNISPYGFRIAEPHHDDTPHWHILLFLEPENKLTLLEIVKHYFFEEDGDEFARHLAKIVDQFGVEYKAVENQSLEKTISL